MNNAALGFTLLIAGLAVFVSALNKTTASMIAGLIYGEAGLKAPKGATPTIKLGEDQPIPGLVVPDVKPHNGPNVFDSLNPGMNNPTIPKR